MEYREDAVLGEVLEDGRAGFVVLDLQVEHVGVVDAMPGDGGHFHKAFVGERLQACLVVVPACHAVVVNDVGTFQLGVEVGCVQFAGQVAGT